MDGIFIQAFKFSADGNRLVVAGTEEDRPVLELFNGNSGEKLKNLTDQISQRFVISTATNRVCAVYRTQTPDHEPVVVRLWNLDDGTPLFSSKVTGEKIDATWQFSLSRDGRYVILNNYEDNSIAVVLSVSDLQESYGSSTKPMRLAVPYYETIKDACWWPDDNGVNVWAVSDALPIQLPGVRIREEDNLIASDDLQRAVIWGREYPAELWDLRLRKRIRTLAPGGSLRCRFTFGDAVAVFEEGNLCSLFAKEDGLPLAQHFTASYYDVMSYDGALRRFHLWNASGQVLRYIEGRSYLGKFVPTRTSALE